MIQVSIPSRGFWFFEAAQGELRIIIVDQTEFQSPLGDFGFLKRCIAGQVRRRNETGFNPLSGILVF